MQNIIGVVLCNSGGAAYRYHCCSNWQSTASGTQSESSCSLSCSEQDLVVSLPLGMNDHMQPEGAAGAATHAELIRWRG